jgi:hypothetical protein
MCVDNPAEARFLTLEERAWAVERLRDNNTGMENKAVKWGQVKEALLSPLIWLYIIVQFANKCVSQFRNPLDISLPINDSYQCRHWSDHSFVSIATTTCSDSL